jgi:hypothetical protein
MASAPPSRGGLRDCCCGEDQDVDIASMTEMYPGCAQALQELFNHLMLTLLEMNFGAARSLLQPASTFDVHQAASLAEDLQGFVTEVSGLIRFLRHLEVVFSARQLEEAERWNSPRPSLDRRRGGRPQPY